MASSVSKALGKSAVLWDGSPPGSAEVPNLFELPPPGCQSVDDKPLNKLRTPTADAFFNRIIETKRRCTLRALGFDTAFGLLNRRTLTYSWYFIQQLV